MAAEQAQQIPTQQTHAAPKTFTLAGRELQCYRAGQSMGRHESFMAAAKDTRLLKGHLVQQLTELRDRLLKHRSFPIPDEHPLKPDVEALPQLGDLEAVAVQYDQLASQNQVAGSRTIGAVAAMETAKAVRWKPPWRAWVLLTLAMTVATTVSTLATTYAIRLGW